MTSNLTGRGGAGTIPIICLGTAELKAWLGEQNAERQSWVETTGYGAKPGSFLLVPGAHGQLDCVLFGLPEERDSWILAKLAGELPPGRYPLGGHFLSALSLAVPITHKASGGLDDDGAMFFWSLRYAR